MTSKELVRRDVLEKSRTFLSAAVSAEIAIACKLVVVCFLAIARGLWARRDCVAGFWSREGWKASGLIAPVPQGQAQKRSGPVSLTRLDRITCSACPAQHPDAFAREEGHCRQSGIWS